MTRHGLMAVDSLLASESLVARLFLIKQLVLSAPASIARHG